MPLINILDMGKPESKAEMAEWLAVFGISIPNVYPEGATLFKDPIYFPENEDQFFDIFFRGVLHSDLPFNFIIPQPPIRRRSDATLDGLIRNLSQALHHFGVV